MKCKSCGADIIYIKTPKGKTMPCDAEQKTYIQDDNGKDVIITPNGEVIKCYISGDMRYVTGIGYTPHWATCPNAEQHRRRG